MCAHEFADKRNLEGLVYSVVISGTIFRAKGDDGGNRRFTL